MTSSGRRLAAAASGRWAMIGVFFLAAVAALRIASSLVLPVILAGLLALLLAPAVTWLSQRRFPPALAAGLVMLTLIFVVGSSVSLLAGPAIAWLDRAPETLAEVQYKIRRLTEPIEQLQETAQKVEEAAKGGGKVEASGATGQAAPGGLFAKISGTTASFAGALVAVVFLSFFLLATAHRIREKVDGMLPPARRKQVREAMGEIQEQMSRYLTVSTSINLGVGVITWGLMKLVGMPNPALWGVVAGVTNFIPYLGALVTIGVILVAGLVSFDEPRRAFLAAGLFIVVNMLEGNVVTPTLLGRRLPLNPVAIFGGLMFWGWLWGVTGAILAVPLTACIKVAADRIEPIKPIGVLLGP